MGENPTQRVSESGHPLPIVIGSVLWPGGSGDQLRRAEVLLAHGHPG